MSRGALHWGPRAWRQLHLAAIAYPVEPSAAEKARISHWLGQRLAGLPCVSCRRHAAAYAAADVWDLSGTFGLQAWVWRFHNAVRVRLGACPLPYDRYLELYADELRAAEGNYRLPRRLTRGGRPA